MRKLFVHIGFAKCGSTSLQTSLSKAPGVVFPISGNHCGEHLALALKLRGIDDWTRQFFDEAWVEKGIVGLTKEISSTTGPIVMSSERLAAMDETQIDAFKALFPDFNIQVIIVRRDIHRYLSSTWRHAVFRHDYGETYEAFFETFKNFSFGNVESKFGSHFPVHVFDMEDDDYAEKVGELIGTTLDIPRENVGVPLELAQLLQRMHALMGSEAFKKRFDAQTKAKLLKVANGDATVQIEPMTVHLF